MKIKTIWFDSDTLCLTPSIVYSYHYKTLYIGWLTFTIMLNFGGKYVFRKAMEGKV